MRFIFLKKNKAQFFVYFIYIWTKIKNIFLKKKIKREKRLHKNFLKDKKITIDFFSSHAFNFFQILKKLKVNFNYLEIGSFEGNSAMYVANRFPNSNIYCLDPWIKTNEYDEHIKFRDIENNFDINTSMNKNIKKIKKSSDEFFQDNHIKFDAIYVDGYHLGEQVFRDVKNSWKFLSSGGYLICDDYIWNLQSENLETTPCFAINKFLREIKNSCKIVMVSNSQIFLKKLNNKI